MLRASGGLARSSGYPLLLGEGLRAWLNTPVACEPFTPLRAGAVSPLLEPVRH